MSVTVNNIDAGGLSINSQEKVIVVQVITDRGKTDARTRINSAEQFIHEFGTPLHDSALQAYKATQLGVKLDAYRVANYTDVADKLTKVGTKATATTNTNVVWDAEDVGTGYNGIQIVITAPKSGTAGKVDLQVVVPNSTITNPILYDMPAVLSAGNRTIINEKLTFVKLTSVVGTLAPTVGTLAAGTGDNSLISDVDIIGNATAKTGIYSFGRDTNPDLRAFNIVSTSSAVTLAYATYCEAENKNLFTFAPIGLTTALLIDFKKATNTYSAQTALNSGTIRLVGGGVTYPHPIRPAESYTSSAAAYIMQACSVRDIDGEFLSLAQPEYAFPSEVRSVDVDYISDKNTLRSAGINVIVNENGTIKFFGNRTTLVNQTLNFSFESVQNLALIVKKQQATIAKDYEDKPNTFKSIRQPMYRRIKKYLDSLVAREAISGYLYQGDQDVEDNSKLVINQLSQPNEYKVNIFLYPVFPAETIEINNTFTVNQQ